MSSSLGNSPAGASTGASQGGKNPGPRDVERGDSETEKHRYSPNLPKLGYLNDEDIQNESDEYIRLLKYIEIEGRKEQRSCDDGGGGDEEEETQRLWYMPWMKVPVKSTKARKVPQSWLETDLDQGLSDSEVADRRDRVGYNELERCANPNAKHCSQRLIMVPS
jgi:H+-transporting ATPase